MCLIPLFYIFYLIYISQHSFSVQLVSQLCLWAQEILPWTGRKTYGGNKCTLFNMVMQDCKTSWQQYTSSVNVVRLLQTLPNSMFFEVHYCTSQYIGNIASSRKRNLNIYIYIYIFSCHYNLISVIRYFHDFGRKKKCVIFILWIMVNTNIFSSIFKSNHVFIDEWTVS